MIKIIIFELFNITSFSEYELELIKSYDRDKTIFFWQKAYDADSKG
jgi:hypothetical protein